MAVVVVAVMVALAIFTATPVETVTVLPSADGHVGTVVVQRGEAQQVLHEAYATSRSGQTEVTRLSADEVQSTYGRALHALPALPATFLLYFVTGTDELTEESKLELNKVLTAMRARPLPDVLVIGHTDTVGDPAANDRLSAQRAETVKGFLAGIGIPVERIRTAGRGERELLVPTASNVDEPRNRRVEINVR
ncbi:MAG TPA: OmpA family protein [Burkholderiales bacterium]|jgi:outer membrane protein OmpA-like peptidoglycan-associated protein|nr:OmpA family protein [Burkholderiales bacterium]